MIVAFVVAMARNRVIGRGGELPWRLPTDLKRFRRLTLGKPVVMGRRTFASIGKALDGRDNIVVTRQAGFAADGVRTAASVPDALALGHTLAAGRGVEEVMVIGGAEIFRSALPAAGRVYLTLVHGDPPGDILMPPLDPQAWQETARQPMQQAEGDQFPADFIVLDRRC